MAKQKIPSIIIETPNLGGIADSPYMGIKNSLASIVGFDLHSIPGVLLVNQKLTKEAGAPTDDLYKIVPCSDGNIYFFGQTLGNVWKKSAGVYSNLGTVAPGAGSAIVLDALEYNGFIYYAMGSRLGQWNFSNAFSTRNDNFGTFTNGSSTYHPMFFLPNAQYIFIGDGNVVAQVDNTNTFTSSALNTIAKNLTVTSLGSQGSDLLIGASTLNNVALSFVLRWNTWSTTPTYAYPIREAVVNAFFPLDEATIINAGISGNLYQLDGTGSTFQIIKQVPPIFPNTYSPTNTVVVNYPAVANKQGIPLFGLSNTSGNVALQGIYSFGRRNVNYPRILALEFPISTGNFSGVKVWSIATSGNDIYVSSFDTGANSFQIDKLDWNNKYSGAYFETLITRSSRVWLDNFDKFVMNLGQTLPNGTQVNVSYRINGGNYVAWSQGTDLYSDTTRNQYTADRRLDARTLQLKVSTTASGNNAPIIEDMIILLKD